MFYLDTERAAALYSVARVTMPKMPSTHNGYVASITDAGSPVKLKIGNVTESQQFKRWFGDWQNYPEKASKVVNEDGTPKLVYHQTGENFTVFETKHVGAGTGDADTPLGIFLKSSDKDIGLRGNRQMALYADIKKPLVVQNREQLADKLSKISGEYAKVRQERRTLNAEYEQKLQDAGKTLQEYVEQWQKENPGKSSIELYDDNRYNELSDAEDNITDEWERKEREASHCSKEAITKDLEAAGYDGIIIRRDEGSFGRSTDAYIAQHPEQVKSATDNIGTFDQSNPDIRYSREMDTVAQESTAENGQKKNAREGVRYSTEMAVKNLEDMQRSLTGKTQREITKRYQAEVDSILNMRDTTKRQLIVGYTPGLLQELGMPALPLTIGSGHVYSATKTEAEAKRDGNFHKGVHYHGLGEAAIKNIYDAIQNPVMVIASKDVDRTVSPMRSTHSVVAIVDIGTAQKSLLVPIEITAERTVNGTRMDVNTISSVYEKSVKNLVTEAIAQENAGGIGIFYAKKEATTLPGAGVQFPIQLQQSIASSGIIHRLSEKVNMKVSDVTQSQQFKRWFGDWQNHPEKASKVVNEDGEPLVMYHGTRAANGDFTVFDYSRAVEKGGHGFKALGKGNYFTSKPLDGSERFGSRVIKAYLSIKNPFVYDGAYGDMVTLAEQVAKKTGADTKGMSYDALQDKMRELGYDGVIEYRRDGSLGIAVAFDSAQIKSATDNIGTFDQSNPDIRYSQQFLDAAENKEIKVLANKVMGGDFRGKERIYLKNISEKNAERIQQLTGINVDGFRVAIEARQIEHILKGHGIDGDTDHSMADIGNVAKIEYALDNPDSIVFAGSTRAYVSNQDGRNKPAKTVLYEKSIGEKAYYVVQAVADTKAKTLFIVSAYIGQQGYKKGAPQFTNAISPGATSKTAAVDTLGDTISQREGKVKGNTQFSREMDTAARESAAENGQKKNAREGVRYSLVETNDGKIAAVIDEDILRNIDLTQWDNQTKKAVKAAAKEALKKFSDGIVVEGITRGVNKTTRNEYTGSNYSEKLAKKMPQLYADKMRAASAINDVVIATTDWARDGGLVHPRTDNFVDFDHGKVLIEAGNNQYRAEVVVGITNKGEAVLYDVVDIQPTHFETVTRKEEPSTAVTTNKSPDSVHEGSSVMNVAQREGKVKGNTQFSREMDTVARESTAEGGQKKNAREGVRYSLEEYSEQQKENWKTSKRIVIYDGRQQLFQFIADSVADKTMDKKMYFGAISAELAARIEADTGVNVEKYNLSLGSYEVRKILKNHGNAAKEAARGQRAITADDFVHIMDVVLNPTKIACSGQDYMGKPAIVFSGEHNGKMNVVAVVSDKRLDLFVQTVYANIKKGNLSTPVGEQAPTNTPVAGSGTVPTSKIAHSPGDVKENTQFSREMDTVDSGQKRTTSLLRTIGFQAPIELRQSGYVRNVTYNRQNVNLSGKKFSDVFQMAKSSHCRATLELSP